MKTQDKKSTFSDELSNIAHHTRRLGFGMTADAMEALARDLDLVPTAKDKQKTSPPDA